MTGYSSQDKVQEFVTKKDMWLRIKLGPKYTPEISARLYAHFAGSGPRNLEKRFEYFVVKYFGTGMLVSPDNQYLTEPTIDEARLMRKLLKEDWNFPERKDYFKTIEHLEEKSD